MHITPHASNDEENGFTFTSSTNSKRDVFDKKLVFTQKRKEQKGEKPTSTIFKVCFRDNVVFCQQSTQALVAVLGPLEQIFGYLHYYIESRKKFPER